jgi:ribonuclease HII
VIGIDEVGLGAWAGPLCVVAAVFLKGWGHPEVKDSKAYTSLTPRVNGAKITDAHEKRMRVLAQYIQPNLLHHAVMHMEPAEIDKRGVATALVNLTQDALNDCLSFYPEAIVVMDGEESEEFTGHNYITFPKADALVPAVSAASIIAKTYRDQQMIKLADTYLGYDFQKNKGYGTPKHIDGLKRHGVCAIHRKSYRPIKEFLPSGGAW